MTGRDLPHTDRGRVCFGARDAQSMRFDLP